MMGDGRERGKRNKMGKMYDEYIYYFSKLYANKIFLRSTYNQAKQQISAEIPNILEMET